MKRDRVKITLFYVLFSLVLLRFVVVPLQNSLGQQKALLSDYRDTYRMKMVQARRRQAARPEANGKAAEEKLSKLLYPADMPYASIQADLLKKLMAAAGKNNLTVVNFGMPDPAALKGIGEAPVSLHIKGDVKGVIGFFKDIDKWDRATEVTDFGTAEGRKDYMFSLSVSAFRREK